MSAIRTANKRSCQIKRKAAIRPRSPLAGTPVVGFTCSLTRINAMAAKPTVHRAKMTEVSATAIRTPPIAGNIIRVPCQSIEFSATALIICSGSIRAGKNETRAGRSKPEIRPSTAAITSTCHTATDPVASSSARMASATPASTEVINSTLRRLPRSAINPPASVAMMAGTAMAPPSRPRSRADPLSSKTSHAMPTKYNCVAPVEPMDPSQKRR